MLNLVNPDTLPPPASKYSHIVEVPDGTRLAFVSGQVGMDRDGHTPEDFSAQCAQVFRNLTAALAAVGMEVSDTVRLNAYLTDSAHLATYRELRDAWAQGHECASTLVMVAALAAPHWQVEVELVAARAR
jgi:enamine deaminase RidA (YjgF/YER057c/UK114 family)